MNRKPYVRYTILGISLLLSLLCVIRIAMPNREWNYAGRYKFVKGVPCTEQEVYEMTYADRIYMVIALF